MHSVPRPHPSLLLRLRGGKDEISTAAAMTSGGEQAKGNRARGRGWPGVSGSSRRRLEAAAVSQAVRVSARGRGVLGVPGLVRGHVRDTASNPQRSNAGRRVH